MNDIKSLAKILFVVTAIHSSSLSLNVTQTQPQFHSTGSPGLALSKRRCSYSTLPRLKIIRMFLITLIVLHILKLKCYETISPGYLGKRARPSVLLASLAYMSELPSSCSQSRFQIIALAVHLSGTQEVKEFVPRACRYLNDPILPVTK